MKIELDSNLPGKNRISAYSSDGVRVGDSLYQSSVVISPEHNVINWPPQRVSDLAAQHFNVITALHPEIVLLGTGGRLVFPDNEILLPLLTNNIGFEIMDTGAACRAYNFLIGEERKVVAALLTIESEPEN